MKVVVAIDSFKGSLTSMQAGFAAKEGIEKVCNANVVVKPLADGGEGTTDALIEGLGGRMIELSVTGPMGTKVKAAYGILSDGKTAVMEMAQAAGIILVDRKELNPWKATTVGVGEMILDATARGCREFMIGIGGSATTEGGIGMLSALGYQFLDEAGNILEPVFSSLDKIASINESKVPAVLKDCYFQIACDVTNPLCGEHGAVYVFGPQKGVKPEKKEIMDQMMSQYAKSIAGFTGSDNSTVPGTGAAGGLGFAFLSMVPNVTLKSGIQIVLEAIELEKELADADIVITGEGRLDFQTAMGKAPVGVAQLAKRYGCTVLAFAGGVTDDAGECNFHGIDAFFPIVRGVCTLDEAMNTETARKNMSLSVEQVFRLLYA
ncbi:MAG: glycerate kinase [Lachnospiraceae bacterium]